MNQNLRWKILAALSASLIILSTQFQIIIFGMIPFTLQTIAIQLSAFSLPRPYGILSILLYLILGLIGFPVFSKGGSGIGHLFGPTGGFLYGFLIATIFIQIFRPWFLKSRYNLLFGIFIHTFILFLFGEIHLSYVLDKPLYHIFSTVMVSFYPAAIFKSIIALLAIETFLKAILRKSLDSQLQNIYLNKV
ncbi:MAG: hypothetical protein COB02_11260 [Candidatus Cloacimonadota bacterium]|nr:MAG: hypothetical protein COB02_11260 [Candidatus Cloacimonadota bacterium]